METPVERLRPRLVFAHAPGTASHQRSRTHLRPHLSLLPQPARSRASSAASFPPRPGGVGPAHSGPGPAHSGPSSCARRTSDPLTAVWKETRPRLRPMRTRPLYDTGLNGATSTYTHFFFFLINTVGPLHILSLVSHPQINQAQM